MLTRRTSIRTLLRTFCLGAAMTTKGMQHIGLLYSLDLGLKEIYGQGKELQRARQRYLSHVHTHPYMAPLLVGFILSFEHSMRKQHLGEDSITRLVHTTATTLSALGDSFFSGSLLLFWALSSSLCIMYEQPQWAIIWTTLLIALLIAFRVYTFFLGLRQGLMALTQVRKWNLMVLSQRLKECNALLIAAILWAINPDAALPFHWGNLFWGVICLIFGTLLIKKTHIPRVVLLCCMFIVLYVHSLYLSTS